MFTTVQDSGRFGHLQYGVPISGAMDRFSCTAANLLIGNDANAATLETTLIGPKLELLTDTQVAVSGGNCDVRVNSDIALMWRTIDLRKGDVLSVGRMETGSRCYIAFRGGIDVPVVLGSRSTYTRGSFGGMRGRQLKAGDLIETFNPTGPRFETIMPKDLLPDFGTEIDVKVVLGPQVDMFTEQEIAAFLSGEYKATSEIDRMGYRLEGPQIARTPKPDIVSDALLPGAVQVPNNGKPIIIMRDAQTTGGYPKIAVVATPDMDRLGQAKPGDAIRFSKIPLAEAQENVKAYLLLLESLRTLLSENA